MIVTAQCCICMKKFEVPSDRAAVIVMMQQIPCVTCQIDTAMRLIE